ncbi:MAG: siderophore-iron reductase FhuF [Aquabacterium sp.]
MKLIAKLAPLFEGEWAPFAETLACVPRPPEPAVRVADILNPELGMLADILQRQAKYQCTPDLRPVASAWSLYYLWALLPPMIAGSTVLQHGFPTAPEEMWLTMSKDGIPECFYILHEGQSMSGQDTMARHGGLLTQHLQPLFSALTRASKLAPKLLWGNAARYLDNIFEQALMLTDQAPHVAQDRAVLLGNPKWPNGQHNPMYGQQKEIDAMEEPSGRLRLHRQCCLYYLLPRESYCTACPLAPRLRPISNRADASYTSLLLGEARK